MVENCDESEEERAKMEVKTESKCSHNPVKFVVRLMITREEQWLPKQRKRMTVLRNDHTHSSPNSFKEHFAIFLDSSISLLTLCRTWTTDPKACAMPTNSNRHMLVQRLLTCTCWMGVCETNSEYVHLEWACWSKKPSNTCSLLLASHICTANLSVRKFLGGQVQQCSLNMQLLQPPPPSQQFWIMKPRLCVGG